MMLTRKTLTRRNFLRGAGVTISLPLLDAMVPALAALRHNDAQAVRLGFVYAPNGMVQEGWLPSKTGTGYQFASTMKPFEPFRNKMLVLSNLMQNNGRPIGDGAGQHSRASATWLTGIAPKRTEGPDLEAGISADQVAASALSKKTPLRSLELGLERPTGTPDSGYNGVYANTISWRTPTTPNAVESNPSTVFKQLFNEKGATGIERISSRGGSILDLVSADSARLRSTLGTRDKSRLDAHLEHVREVELRVRKNNGRDFASSYQDRADLMIDLMVLAFQTDMTRVASLMLAKEGSDLAYHSIGVAEGHHTVSHHAGDSDKIASTMKINALHAKLFAQLLQKMDATPDGDGTLLDHSMVLFGSSLSDGNAHLHHDLPLVLAGGARCNIKGGHHIRYADETPMNNLLVAMLNKAGVPVEKHGDSTGELDLRSIA